MAASDDPAARLADLLTKANLQYELKNYTAAADIYSEAAEAQSELRGEMAPENADLLYLYGRCLYKVAIAKSDVLGGRVAGEEKKQKKGKRGGESKKAKGAEEGDAREKKPKEEEGNKAAAPSVDSKPYFQIIGDENWDTESDESGSDGEGAASGDEDEDDNDDDDLGTAYEILDLARVLLTKQLDDARAATASATTASPTSNDKGKGKARASTPPTNPTERKLSERLADTHDLQAEINLENERFSDSVSDFRAALTLKQSLYPRESALVAEAHFKLSLALEFASMTRVREAQARAEAGEKVDPADAAAAVDEEARAEAVTHMESAIESCRARIAVEEEALAGLKGERAEEARRQIEDVRDMTEDMEGRLADLRAPAVTTTNPTADAAATNPLLSGLLADVLGGAAGGAGAGAVSEAEQRAKIQAASDISGLVKRRKPASSASAKGGKEVKAEAGEGLKVAGKGRKRGGDEEGAGEGEGVVKRVKSEAEAEGK